MGLQLTNINRINVDYRGNEDWFTVGFLLKHGDIYFIFNSTTIS
jgi:hypothetical protein